MLANYLKIAVRTLRRHAGYALLNVAGLAIGLAACLLILLHVRDELSYDRFHAHADRIYRVVASNSEDGQPTNANGAYAWAAALENAFSDVEQAVRLHRMGWGEERVVAHEDRRFYESRFFFADPAFFQVFSFPFVAGDPATALDEPGTVVITRSTAEKYFGRADALGEVLSIDPFNDGQFADYRVTGVVEDMPSNSHLKLDLLGSWSSQQGRRVDGWGWDPVYTYVLLEEGASAEALNARLAGFIEQHLGEHAWYTIGLQPITDIRLHSGLRAELEPNGDIAYVYVFSAVALLVLLIACINFMNLATARSARRAREIGMRKVLGARRWQLVGQFLGEAVLLSLGATVLAVVLVHALLPVFNAIADKELEVSILSDPALAGALVGLALLVGLAAGSYPAFVLSAFRPVEALKGQRQRSGAGGVVLRKGLVVFQFGVSIFLIACTAVIYKQVDFIRSKDLGFAREQVLVLPLNDEVRAGMESVKRELTRHPAVRSVAASEQVPGRAGNGASYLVDGLDEPASHVRLFTDQAFVETYGIEMAAGRSFSEQFPTDSTEAFVVNEAFVREMGWTDARAALNRPVQMWWGDVHRTGRIVGVTNDFHLFSMRDEVSPVVLTVMPDAYLNFLSVRVDAAQVQPVLGHLGAVWAAFAPSYPLDYYFVDQDFDRLHRADLQVGRLFRSFALLAIFVACLGLFGLAAYAVEQRTKEVGIRKVMGASAPGIVALLSGDFARLVLLAFVVGAPLSYLAMERWLGSFAYRVEIRWTEFLMAGGLVLLVALLTVSYQTVRAALADPVKVLRYE